MEERKTQPQHYDIPLREIAEQLNGALPQYVLVVVAEKEGDHERVVHCDLREYRDALGIYVSIQQTRP